MILPILHFTIERWKYNEDYEIYVSNLGNFRYKNRKKKVTTKINSSGYISVLSKNGVVAAHRLVLLTFKPIADAAGMTVDHLDSNKRNNSLSNLEWTTRKENLKRAKENRLENERKYFIFDSYGNRYDNCIKAAIGILTENGMSREECMVNKTASRIGQSVRSGKKYFGTFWYCRNLKGESKAYK